jgi:CrcB protein
MTSILLVALGGVTGSLVRFLLVNIFNTPAFAYGTLFANALGSLLAGVFFVILSTKFDLNPEYKNLLIIGFCGSLTTLSTISLDSVNLFTTGDYQLAIINLFANIMLSVMMVILGVYLTKIIF